MKNKEKANMYKSISSNRIVSSNSYDYVDYCYFYLPFLFFFLFYFSPSQKKQPPYNYFIFRQNFFFLKIANLKINSEISYYICRWDISLHQSSYVYTFILASVVIPLFSSHSITNQSREQKREAFQKYKEKMCQNFYYLKK